MLPRYNRIDVKLDGLNSWNLGETLLMPPELELGLALDAKAAQDVTGADVLVKIAYGESPIVLCVNLGELERAVEKLVREFKTYPRPEKNSVEARE
jgi:hypothetical protein